MSFIFTILLTSCTKCQFCFSLLTVVQLPRWCLEGECCSSPGEGRPVCCIGHTWSQRWIAASTYGTRPGKLNGIYYCWLRWSETQNRRFRRNDLLFWFLMKAEDTGSDLRRSTKLRLLKKITKYRKIVKMCGKTSFIRLLFVIFQWHIFSRVP